MTWNYRIIRHHGPKEEWLGLHEVYYDGADKPKAYTVNPIGFVADASEGAEGIISGLQNALEDAKCYPILDETDFPSGKSAALETDADSEVDRQAVATRQHRKRDK